MRQQNERQGALEGYLSDPENEVSVKRLAAADPSLGFPLMQQRQAAQRQSRVGELAARASQGDNEAAMELWKLDPDLATRFDERTQKLLKQGQEAVGNAALRIWQLPDDQIGAAADAAIEELATQFPNLAQYKGHVRTREDLAGILDQTGMTEKALTMSRERWTPVPQGASLVNTNDPAAIAEFNARNGVPTPAAPDAAVDYLRKNPQFAPQFDQKYGAGASQRYLNGGPTPPASGNFP